MSHGTGEITTARQQSERNPKRGSESNSKQSNDRWTTDMTQLSLPASISMTGERPCSTKTNDRAMKENEDFITHFPFTPFPAHTLPPPRLLMCVHVRVFLHWEVNQMCVVPSWQAGLGSRAGPGVQFREITHTVGGLWKKCPRSGTCIRYLGSLCARVRMHACMCVYGRVFLKGHLSHPQI